MSSGRRRVIFTTSSLVDDVEYKVSERELVCLVCGRYSSRFVPAADEVTDAEYDRV